MYYKAWRISIALLKWIDKLKQKSIQQILEQISFRMIKNIAGLSFSKYMLFKKAQFLRSLLSKRVLLLFEIKWSVPSYYEQALIQECKSNEDCYQGSGVVIKMRTIHWDLYYISHACPHIYRTSTTMHIVIVAIVACWKHLEKCHLSDEVQFGQQ